MLPSRRSDLLDPWRFATLPELPLTPDGEAFALGWTIEELFADAPVRLPPPANDATPPPEAPPPQVPATATPPWEDPSGPAGEPPGAEGSAFTGRRPADALFAAQWHLSGQGGADINLRNVWDAFSGRGISVAVLDDGFDHRHADLRAGYDFARDRDFVANDLDAMAGAADRHGTAVMGVIGADQGGGGLVGVAHDATLAGLRIGFGSAGNPAQYAAALREGARFDVTNSSWGYTGFFADNFNSAWFAASEAALAHGTSVGRGGLGTVHVFAAGNSRAAGDNVNHHNFQNSIHTIAVAATDAAGRIAGFSTPGAAVHVAAPGVSIMTTDALGTLGYSAGDSAWVSGTSFAAPAVAGVVALMLDANERLGWRDVQEILAYTARQTDPGNATWKFNAARDFNGGGLHTSTDFGFGLVDAHAAVRLAETWMLQSTSANMFRATASATPNRALTDAGTTSFTLNIGQDLTLDRVELALDLRHTARGDLRITLVSPNGTESVLIDRMGLAPGRTGRGDMADNIIFDLTSSQFWGESARGTWTLRVQDLVAGERGSLVSWRLDAFGDAPRTNNTYVYTDEFAQLGAQAARRVLSDSAGVDTINAAAVTGNSLIDLVSGAVIAGRAISYAAGTVIERAFGGDGADAIRGNGSANLLWGGRGNDALAGRAGADIFAFGAGAGRDVIEDFHDEDLVWLLGGVRVAQLSGHVATLTDGSSIIAGNGHLWHASDFALRDGWLA